MKQLRRYVFFFLLTLGLVLSGAGLAVWLGQDRIIALFVQEANRYLRTPVQVGHMEVSLLDQFPQVSITLHQVRVSGSLLQDTVPLARARRLYFAFDAWDLWRGHYRIRTATLTDAQVRVGHDAQGQANYDILNTTPASATDPPFAFALENIQLEKVGVVYDDRQRQQRYTVQVHDVRAELDIAGPVVAISAKGQTHVEGLRQGTDVYFADKDLLLVAKLSVDRASRQVRIQPSELRVQAATYGLAGRIGYAHGLDLDLRLEGRQTDVQSVLALLPARLTRRLAAYRSRGDVYFGGTVRGPFSRTANPQLNVAFGCRNASFYHPDYKQAVEHVFLTGSFTNGVSKTARTAVLTLRDVRGTLQGRPFSGNLRYENLQDPTIKLSLQANLDVARALRFFPVAAVHSGSGEAQLKLAFAGNWREFRARPASPAVQSEGELTLRGVAMRLRDFTQPFVGLNGTFVLRGNDVALTRFVGRVGRSDFQVNGNFRNARGWLLLPGQQLAASADLASNLLDFNQLLRLRTAQARGSQPKAGSAGAGYEFQLSPLLALDLRTNVQRVQFRRFRGRELRGTLRLRNQVLSAPSLTVAAAGGRASFRGSLDARQPAVLHLRSTTTCQQVPLDSLFYVFENFGQQFITSRHLRGALTASAESDLFFDRGLTPLTDRMEAEINLSVRDGQLNNFAPLQKLSMIASRERLRHLRFAQLTTPVYIQSRTVYLPEMEIRSNVKAASRIHVTGTHTFDQQMDYHVSIPILPGLLARTAPGGVASSGPSLLLAIQGDENNFRVSYDRSRGRTGAPAVAERRKGVLEDILRPSAAVAPAEGAATKAPEPPRKAFELKKPEKKTAQPQTGEYFEF